MQVKTICEILADAVILEEKELVPSIPMEEAAAGRRILVVDDEEDIGTYLTTFFENNGFETTYVENAEEAWKILQTETPDLITLDILMPGKSGIGFYRKLRGHEPTKGIPVLFITGCNPQSGHPDARKYIYTRNQLPPPEGFLDKPVDRDELLLTVRKILEVGRKAEATA